MLLAAVLNSTNGRERHRCKADTCQVLVSSKYYRGGAWVCGAWQVPQQYWAYACIENVVRVFSYCLVMINTRQVSRSRIRNWTIIVHALRYTDLPRVQHVCQADLQQ